MLLGAGFVLNDVSNNLLENILHLLQNVMLTIFIQLDLQSRPTLNSLDAFAKVVNSEHTLPLFVDKVEEIIYELPRFLILSHVQILPIVEKTMLHTLFDHVGVDDFELVAEVHLVDI